MKTEEKQTIAQSIKEKVEELNSLIFQAKEINLNVKISQDSIIPTKINTEIFELFRY